MENNEVEEEVLQEKTPAGRSVAVVVGGSSGIGLEAAAKLAAKGYTVINISRSKCPSERIRSVTADIFEGDELEEALNSVGEEYGRIDVLIYSAGYSMAAPVEHVKEKDYRYLFEINYFGALRTLKCVIPKMKEFGGKIVLVSSMASLLPIPFDSFYSSSKAALTMLAKSVRSELKAYKIYVTAVEPGGTATGFTFKRKVYSDEENGAYYKDVNKAVAALGNMEQGGASAVEVASCIINAIESDSPPITLACGGKNKSFKFMSRILPEKLVCAINDKSYNQ